MWLCLSLPTPSRNYLACTILISVTTILGKMELVGSRSIASISSIVTFASTLLTGISIGGVEILLGFVIPTMGMVLFGSKLPFGPIFLWKY